MQQIPFLIALAVSFLGYILFYYQYLKCHIEIVPLLVVLTQVICLYFAGLLGILPVMVAALFGVGFILLAGVLFAHRKNLQAFLLGSVTPGFVLFWLSFGLLWLISRKLSFVYWDEFSHWGIIYKLILMTDQLPGKENGLIFPDYPPGTAVFEYYVAKIIGRTEGSAYFANNLIIVTPLVALLSGVKWRQWYRGMVVFLAVYLWFHFLGFQFNSLYIDGLLGLIFAIGVILCTQKMEGRFRTVLPILLVCAALPIIKQAGLFFGLSVAAVYGVQSVYQMLRKHRRSIHAGEPAAHPNTGKLWSRVNQLALVALLVIALSPLVMYKTWNLHMAAYGFNNTFNADLNAKAVMNSFSASATPRDRATISAFIDGFKSREIETAHLSTNQILMILGAVAVGLAAWRLSVERDQALIFSITQATVLACILAYLCGLLLAYLFSFSEYEGTRIASFERYSATALLGWGVILLDGLQIKKRGPFTGLTRLLSMAGSTLVVVILFFQVPSARYSYLQAPGVPGERAVVANLSNEFAAKLEPDAKIYDIWQNTSGYLHHVIRYEFSPHIFEIWGWTLGAPYDAADVWTVNLSPAEWMSRLTQEQFDYVLVAQSDAPFWQTYGGLFVDYEPENHPQLFKVTADRLIRVR